MVVIHLAGSEVVNGQFGARRRLDASALDINELNLGSNFVHMYPRI